MASPFIATARAADRQELDLLQQSIRARKGILACGDEYAAAVTAGGGCCSPAVMHTGRSRRRHGRISRRCAVAVTTCWD